MATSKKRKKLIRLMAEMDEDMGSFFGKKQMQMKEKLNSEWVKKHESETFFLPSWQEAYRNSH